jgi:hypothetical protein
VQEARIAHPPRHGLEISGCNHPSEMIADHQRISDLIDILKALENILESSGAIRTLPNVGETTYLGDNMSQHGGRGEDSTSTSPWVAGIGLQLPIQDDSGFAESNCLVHKFNVSVYTRTNLCLAMGKKCSKCGKLNHFATVCRSKDAKTKAEPSENTDKAVKATSAIRLLLV